MRIPLYWSKATAEGSDERGRATSFSCWRSSDVSVEDAQQSALATATKVLQKLAADSLGGRYPYGDAPLREEVVQRFEDAQGNLYAAVTRNGYGSLVLNAARVMFIDIDFPATQRSGGLMAFFARLFGKSPPLPDAQQEQEETQRIDCSSYSNTTGLGHSRLSYAGRRPRSGDARPFRSDFRCGLGHAEGCRGRSVVRAALQGAECFRARLTPKPWRCGHNVNRTVWPREGERQQQRFDKWLAAYMSHQSQYATCRYLGTLGSNAVHPDVETIVEVHDQDHSLQRSAWSWRKTDIKRPSVHVAGHLANEEGARTLAEPIISVSGLRGVVGETLTPEVAIRYAAAFAATLPPGDILIGRDSRPSGRMLSLAVQAGLQAVGRTTIDAGIVATPTAGVLLRHYAAAGAIQITASHNPAPYNGLKLFSAEGRVIPAGPGREVLERYRTGTPAWLPQDRLGSIERCEDTVTAHLLAVLETVDAERIRKQRFRVLLDSNHGAGSILGRRLLHELGCRVTVLGEEPDGQFAHPAEPTAENLAGVLTAVSQSGADVGFCQDPDADRLAVIDATGRYLGEEYTLAMCVDHVLRQRKGPDRRQLCQQPDVARPGRAIRRAVFPFGRGRGERGRCDAGPRCGFRRRRQRRPDRSARRLRPRQFRGHGPAVGRDGRPANDDRPVGRRAAALRNREDEDFACRRRSCRRRWMRWKSDFPTPRAIGSTACVSIGPAAGSWSAAATPSRSSARSPRPRRPRKRRRYAKRRRKCWPRYESDPEEAFPPFLPAFLPTYFLLLARSRSCGP